MPHLAILVISVTRQIHVNGVEVLGLLAGLEKHLTYVAQSTSEYSFGKMESCYIYHTVWTNNNVISLSYKLSDWPFITVPTASNNKL